MVLVVTLKQVVSCSSSLPSGAQSEETKGLKQLALAILL